jgi:hypothetical protein
MSDLPPLVPGFSGPSEFSPDGIRMWIVQVCKSLGITPTELAREANLAASTINRFLRSSEDETLSGRTLEAITATAIRLTIERDAAPKPLPRDTGLSEEIFRTEVPFMGKAAVGHKEVGTSAFAKHHYRLVLPIPAPYHTRWAGIYEVGDNHADPVFPKGTLLVTSFFVYRQKKPNAEKPRDGDFVGVFTDEQSTSGKEGEFLRNLTFRKLVVSPSNDVWLIPINSKYPDLKDTYLGNIAEVMLEENRSKLPWCFVIGSYRHQVR